MYSGFLRTMVNLCLRIRFELAFILHKITELFYEKANICWKTRYLKKRVSGKVLINQGTLNWCSGVSKKRIQEINGMVCRFLTNLILKRQFSLLNWLLHLLPNDYKDDISAVDKCHAHEIIDTIILCQSFKENKTRT